MKRIIIHVGSGKAGSTSIQQALFHGRSQNNAIYTYPVMPDSPGNQVIRYAFCRDNSVPQNIKAKYSNKKGGDLQVYKESIISSFREQCENSNTVILSSEFLFHSCEDEVLRLGMLLREMGFLEIHVLMYLRDPAKYYISSAQQALKKRYNMPLPTNFSYDMLGAIERWSNIMPTSITIREFHTLSLHCGDVVKDFAQYLSGIDINARLDAGKLLNESMTSELTQAIQDCHKYLSSNLVDEQIRSEKIKKIMRLIRCGSVGGTKPKLKPELERYIHNRFSEQLMGIYSRHGIFGRIVSGFTGNESETNYNDRPKISLFREIVEEFDDVCYENIKSKELGI